MHIGIVRLKHVSILKDNSDKKEDNLPLYLFAKMKRCECK